MNSDGSNGILALSPGEIDGVAGGPAPIVYAAAILIVHVVFAVIPGIKGAQKKAQSVGS